MSSDEAFRRPPAGSGLLRLFTAMGYNQRWPVIAYWLVVDGIGLALLTYVLVTSTQPAQIDWERFALVLVGGLVYYQLSRRDEESRRGWGKVLYIDTTSVWTFGATVALPPVLALALIILMRVAKWPIARRPLHRYVFSSSCAVLASYLAAITFHLVYVPAFHGHGHSLVGSLVLMAALLTAGLVFGVVQAVLVGLGILMDKYPKVGLGDMFGSAEANQLDALCICLGAITGVLLHQQTVLVLLMIPVAWAGNKVALVQHLQSNARLDAKTGLLNHDRWKFEAERLLLGQPRTRCCIGLLMIDLDHFKAINDHSGHRAGDEVLRAVAEVLRTQTRRTDLVGRFGGEEFVVLLPTGTLPDILVIAERIRTAIRAVRVETEDLQGRPVVIDRCTASIGVAVAPRDGLDFDVLMQVADARLYAAKDAGRDQVWAQDPPARRKAPEPEPQMPGRHMPMVPQARSEAEGIQFRSVS
ncbi:GGDEF domain-containing protein [Pseudonocardiaceae bacterium YIM PH 21723]|nr:GGDEF domain-containing protein [Pseudonocardiaceae bacterium YIM PH 21723]